MKILKRIAVFVMFIMMAAACQKEEMGGARMQVNLTDAPAQNYQSVFIDLQKVMVHYEGTPGEKWIELKANPGIYDLLTLRNNVNVVIADEVKLPLGKISQIRLVLGSQNSVVVEGNKFGLVIPSSNQSGLKINVHQTIRRNDFVILTLDFDAQSSVNLNGNGEYEMKPVIKVKEIIYN